MLGAGVAVALGDPLVFSMTGGSTSSTGRSPLHSRVLQSTRSERLGSRMVATVPRTSTDTT